MPQLLLQGFPDGAIRIGATLSVLKKDARVTYFVGGDNFCLLSRLCGQAEHADIV